MKFIQSLLQEAKKSEMDPSQVTASDISAYVRQVKSALKGQKITKGSVASAIREIAEDDPKFGAHPKALPQLIAAVAAKLVPVKESVDDEDEDEDDKSMPGKFSASTPKDELKKQAAYLKDEMAKAGDNRALTIRLKLALKKINGFLGESLDADEEETIPGKFSASTPKDELKKQAAYLKAEMAKAGDNRALTIRLKLALKKINGFLGESEDVGMSPRAEAALTNKMDATLEEATRIDVDELTTTEISAKLMAAAKAAHPDAKGLKVHADDKMMYVQAGDRSYATVSLTTGVVTVLKEGWDMEDDDEDADVKAAEDEARKRKIKLMSPRAEQAMSKKFAKADKKDEDKSSKKVVAEGVKPGEVVNGVNDPMPKEDPKPGMKWLRMKGGPQDGQWVQVKVTPVAEGEAEPKKLGRFAQALLDAKSA